MIKRVVIFGFVLVVLAAILTLVNSFAGFLPSFLVPLFNIAVSLFVLGSVMYYVFKD